MSDKDQFTFEDDDDYPEKILGDRDDARESIFGDKDFPETSLEDQQGSQGLGLNYDDDFPDTDLSAAFIEGEHAIDDQAQGDLGQQVRSGGSSRTKGLLLVLLIIVAGGAGAYYFMDLGGTTPSVPTAPVPVQNPKKSVALPAQPASKVAPPATAEPAAKPVSVAVPPPQPVAPAADVEQTRQADTAATAQTPAVVIAEGKGTATAPVAMPVAMPAPAQPETAAKKEPEAAPEKPASTDGTPLQAVGGAFTLDAGAYLLEANRDALVEKIKQLGYEPLVTTVDATLNMTRLRLGTFGRDEVQEALDFARTIEPGAYSAPAGDGYVVYAGTFLQSSNIDKLSQHFLKEGIKVHPEPVQVTRTLNRIRFGHFATREDASAAAREMSDVGVKADVVKFK